MSTAVRQGQSRDARGLGHAPHRRVPVPTAAVGALASVLGSILLAQMVGLTAAGWAAVAVAGLCLCLCGLMVPWWRNSVRAVGVDALYTLSPAEFEHYVAGVFAASGYSSSVVGGSGDGGVDVRVWRDGRCGVVQCKRYRPDRTLGPAAVRELVGTRAHERAHMAWLATTASLSPAALQLALDEGVGVLDARVLVAHSGWAGRRHGPTTPRRL